jgi:hypothetical protein
VKVLKLNRGKTRLPRSLNQPKISTKKRSIPGLLVAPNQRSGQLKSIAGAQFILLEANRGKVTQVVGRLYFAPNFTKHRQPPTCHFHILRRQRFLPSPPA